MAKGKSAGFSMELVKKYYFWVVVPIMLGVAFYVTGVARSAIKKEFEAKKNVIESEKNSSDQVASNNKHPNDKTIEAIKAETNILKKSVYQAWMLMYSDQKARNRWPRQLSREFLDLVERLAFRAPIDPSQPRYREGYAFFIGNHLPDLLKQVRRRRCQVQDYKFVEASGRFYPVYVDEEKGTYYLLITEGEDRDQTGPPKVSKVLIYDMKMNELIEVKDSARRDAYIGKKPVPYYREMDPWIVKPKDHMSFGAISTTGGMMDGMGGGGMEGMAMPDAGMMESGARGAMGDMGGSSAGVAIPGEGIDPALEQIQGISVRSNEEGMGAQMGGNSLGAQMESRYPGLPPYLERKRTVGNVDWNTPEIYSLPTWSQDGYPTSIEIWYAQESLWVYEALLRVIAKTNEEFPDNINAAPIKRISALLIGQPAGMAWSSIKTMIDLIPSSGSAGMMGGPGMGPGDMMAGGPPPGATGPTGAPTENDILLQILLGRYLDGENKPLAAQGTPPFAEFNKMPICMKLIIDQRRIPDLLVNCANCTMPIDIKHVRISPENVEHVTGVASGGEGGMEMMDGGMGPGMDVGGPGPGMGGGARGAAGGEQSSASGGVDVGRSAVSQIPNYGVDAINIEVYGIINIFNKPNVKDFGTGQDATNARAQMTEEAMKAPEAAPNTTEPNTPNASDPSEGSVSTSGAAETAGAPATSSSVPATPSQTPPAGSGDAVTPTN